ncbi:YqcC family protein [Endozoicomonas sp. G2_1]|uniref:YqcC family protein n=1 Tax=Endozoicomonas sp. G2_1 TaxID=2821091 RepID=UPI001ADD1E59|nr:YqcC family protein [Endozoicomonas sp. G2_1]
MPTKVEILSQQLLNLTHQLKKLDLWQLDKPSQAALASQQPFCLDTLRFEQWLQFIFIERMQIMIGANHPLPENIALCPMAEEAFKALGSDAADMINVIADIDELLSGQRQQTLYRVTSNSPANSQSQLR